MNAPPNRGGSAPARDELAGYFSEHGPVPAPTHELIDSDAATRVADASSLFPGGNGNGYGDAPGSFPTNPGGWQPVGTDSSEAMTLNADQMRAHLPAMEGYGEARTNQFNPQGDNYGYGDHAFDGSVVDPNEPAHDYGMVPFGEGAAHDSMPSWSPPSYSMLRINPAEHVDGGFSPDLVLLSHPDGFAAAQFRTLRYRLEQEPDLQVIVVTSARDGDGKSVTAANLALALAEGGRIQVLLIDASLRNPAQHRLFGVNGDLGLTSVLAARQNDPSLPVDVIRITASLNLMPAGPAVASAHAALSSEAAAVLMGQLRREFRYIIVDSAAVFGTAETLAWHGLIDKYIVTARAGRTTTEDLTATCERLQKERIVGVTFLGPKIKRR
ncbi:MAG: ATPase involved in chromosome partitioning-like protein [Myxococcaceae bacterium]|nr:ATPase involved in chromosome partitioning-like protein [Myxococcaceae bacterium]